MKSPLFDSLTRALEDGSTERSVCKWIKENPLIVSHSVSSFAFANRVVAEFPFGNQHRCDFVALGGFSGGFTVNFVECEPPDSPLFTKKGIPAERLNQALAQVRDWVAFSEKHRSTVLHDLSLYFKKKELIWKHNDEPRDNVGWNLYHPEAWVQWNYHIIIGRRNHLTEEELGKKVSYIDTQRVHIMTYDRLLDAARKLDKAEKELAQPGSPYNSGQSLRD